jgi:hypothetical protein
MAFRVYHANPLAAGFASLSDIHGGLAGRSPCNGWVHWQSVIWREL